MQVKVVAARYYYLLLILPSLVNLQVHYHWQVIARIGVENANMGRSEYIATVAVNRAPCKAMVN